jgi:3,4-dihydroxy-2-butanone 4-phosphate synthase
MANARRCAINFMATHGRGLICLALAEGKGADRRSWACR